MIRELLPLSQNLKMNEMILLVLIERELSEGKSCYVPDTALNGLVQALE